jgi:hypothetical protein
MPRISSTSTRKAAIVVISCAVLFGAVNTHGAARYEQRNTVYSNPDRKGDRLPLAFTGKAPASSPNAKPSSAGRPPLGCDPMFSPVADPAHAGIYRRCMV